MIRFTGEADRDHFLCAMDARVKIICAVIILGMVLSYKGWLFPLAVFILGVSSCFSMGIRLRTLLFRFSEPLFIIIIIILLKTFFCGAACPISFSIFGLNVAFSSDGLRDAMLMGCRIMAAVATAAILGFSTPFSQFMSGLASMRVPGEFVEVSMFAYRYIFMLFDDAIVIYNAQRNRLGYSNMRRGLNSFGILAGSLVVRVFENSQNVAVAMTQRGYDGTMPTLERRPFRPLEIILSAFVLIIMGILWRI